MRRSDDDPLDPEAGSALAVIDATLAGEAVEPEHAELAELTLILAGQRPDAEPGVRRRARRAGGRALLGAAARARPGRRRGPAAVGRRWLWAPGAMAGRGRGRWPSSW